MSPLHSEAKETDKTDEGAQPLSLPASAIDFLMWSLAEI
jgi:hypothetical protein